MGLAVGCLQYGMFVLPALLVAFARRRRDGIAKTSGRDVAWLLVSVAIVAASIAVFYGCVWRADPGRDISPFRMEAPTLHAYGHPLSFANFAFHGAGPGVVNARG